MKNPRNYLEEVRQNVQKMRAQGQVTPTENALFGMLDGLAGLMHRTMERVTELERRKFDLWTYQKYEPLDFDLEGVSFWQAREKLGAQAHLAWGGSQQWMELRPAGVPTFRMAGP